MENELRPFGVEYLEPLEDREARGGDMMDDPECCVTYITSTDPDFPSGYACGDSDVCVAG